MAGDDRKRQRKSSDSKQKSPSETQASKKVRQFDNLDESLTFDDKTENKTKVSEENMAVKPDELIEALKVALQDESVIDKLKFALCEQIKLEIRQEYDIEINTLKSEIAIRDNQIEELRQRTEELEMYGRRNGIRIYGIKESATKNTDKLVLKLAGDIGVDVTAESLGRSHRVGPKITTPTGETLPRPIIAKFTGHNSKVEVLKKKRISELMTLRKYTEKTPCISTRTSRKPDQDGPRGPGH